MRKKPENLGEMSDQNASLTPREGEREGKLDGKVLDCHESKEYSGRSLRVLEPNSGFRGVLCLPGVGLSQHPCHTQSWLSGSVECGEWGLSAQVLGWLSILLPVAGGFQGAYSWLPHTLQGLCY